MIPASLWNAQAGVWPFPYFTSLSTDLYFGRTKSLVGQCLRNFRHSHYCQNTFQKRVRSFVNNYCGGGYHFFESLLDSVLWTYSNVAPFTKVRVLNKPCSIQNSTLMGESCLGKVVSSYSREGIHIGPVWDRSSSELDLYRKRQRYWCWCFSRTPQRSMMTNIRHFCMHVLLFFIIDVFFLFISLTLRTPSYIYIELVCQLES